MTATITDEQARRLALHAQGLADPPRPGTGVGEVVARIGCLQLDPVGVVARSPLLVLRARLRGGTHDSHERDLARAAYRDRELFDYWCHEASLCHVDDLAIHRWAMRTYLERLSDARSVTRRWLRENAAFAEHTEAALRERGPLRARELEDHSEASWEWGHWTDEVSSRQNIARLLDRLWMQGRIGIADRIGIERRWDLMERCLPPGAIEEADADPPGEGEVVRRAVLRAVGMLGVARAPHINAHFTRRRYPGLGGAGRGVIGELERSGELTRVAVAGLKGDWWALPRGPRGTRLAHPGQTDDRALALRQPALRSRPDGGAVRLRPPARDLRAGRQAALGLLRAPDPARRAAGRPRRPAPGPGRECRSRDAGPRPPLGGGPPPDAGGRDGPAVAGGLARGGAERGASSAAVAAR